MVDLGDVGDRAFEERAVMADECHGSLEAEYPPLQPVQSIEVEIVGRLVEQHDIEPREQQRRQRDPCGLATGQRDGRLGADSFGEPRSANTCPARASKSATRARATVQGLAVLVVRAGRPLPTRVSQRRARAGQRRFRSCAEETIDGLGVGAFGFLRQIPDRCRRRARSSDPSITVDRDRRSPGERAQQRRLPDSVRADDTDTLPRREAEVDGRRACRDRETR